MAESEVSSDSSRLIITKIVNEDFKSYAGVRTLGPFHKNFTAIVGPNGSGKSNVIDAMLFVFGYRASKIRSKKVSVLIHNSDRRKNVEKCTVTVHFAKIRDLPGNDDFETISSFFVSRTAFRDNSSFYAIDGKRVQFRDVAALLRREGIDLDHNRFLILQGEVELISQMKPKAPTEHEDGMLEYLEDIIGSSSFKSSIEEAGLELEKLAETRGEKLNRVKAMEKEISQLEEAKDEAVEFIKLENELTKKRHLLHQHFIYKCGKEEEEGIETKEKILKERAELEEKLKSSDEKKVEIAKRNENDVKAYEELSDSVEKAKAAFAQCERRDVKLREDLKHGKEKEKKLKKALEKETAKVEELKLVPEECQREIEELERTLPSLEERKAREDLKLKEILASLKDATLELQNEKDAKEQILLQKEEAVNEVRAKHTVAKAELDLLTGEHGRQEEALQKAKEDLEHAQKTATEKSKDLKRFENEFPVCKREIEETERELAGLVQREKQLSTKVKTNRIRVQEEKSSMQASQSQNKVLKSLLEQKRLGNIAGIHGRLGDLGAIDDDYDVAVSTACGPLDFIVVDTMDVAVKCVDFLKKHDLGIATFIGLDKMEKWAGKASQKINTPENVPRLFDLIRFKDRQFASAFYYGLRDTLVAKDLEQATRIAYKGNQRYRVVTLKGELIDISGTMSGGGKKVSKGRMSSKVQSEFSAADVRKMEIQLETDAKELEELHVRKEEAERRLVELKNRVQGIEHEMKKCAIDINGSKLQVKELKKRVPEMEAELKQLVPDPKKVKTLQKNVEKLKQELDVVEENAGVVKAEVRRIHDQIMEITHTQVKSQQDKVDHVSGEIDESNSKITKAKVAIKTAERNLIKTEKKVESLGDDVKQTTEKIKQLQTEIKALDGEATTLLNQAETAQSELGVYAERVKRMQKELSVVEEAESHISKKLVDIKHHLQRAETRVSESQKKIKMWKKEIDKMTLQSLTLEGEQVDEFHWLPEDELAQIDEDSLKYQVSVFRSKQKDMNPNMAAIEEYRRKEHVYMSRVQELEGVTKERDLARQKHDELRKKRLDSFMAGFTFITAKLKEMYQMITLGGDAELELVDSLDPFSEGIVFSVRPPKKSWKSICNLSGGEKTLSSLALVFALHQYKPSPLYVMDEIDAALDVKNVSIVGHYIKERTKNAQFVIISLRPNMFELSNRMIGIFKVNDCTGSVSIDTPITQQA